MVKPADVIVINDLWVRDPSAQKWIELPRRSLEALREPLEEGWITISRSEATIRFPSVFLLIAAMNPCPCGYSLHPRRVCHCSPERIRRYLEKVSGPLLDRIDVRLEIQAADTAEMLATAPQPGGDTHSFLELVETARSFQDQQGRSTSNRYLEWSDRQGWAPLARAAERLLYSTATQFNLSTRGLTRVLRLARTIADTEGSTLIEERYLLEALEYRCPGGGEGVWEMMGV